jgi:hypothetical protein
LSAAKLFRAILALWMMAAPAWADGLSASMSPQMGGGVGSSTDGGISFKASSGPVFNAQATAFFARLATQPNAARKTRYNTFFAALVAAGFYPSGVPICDAIYAFQARDQATALTNLVSSNFTGTLSGQPTFNTDGGFYAPDATSFIDSNLNPSTAVSANYLQNSASIFAYTIISDAIAGETAGYGPNAAGYAELYPRYADNNRYTALNAVNESAGVAVTDASGLLALDRASSTGYTTYKNGVSIATPAANSTALDNSHITFLTQGPHGYNMGSVQFGGACGHLTAAQHLALYNAIVAYRTGIASDYPTIRRLAGSRTDMATINTTVAAATANTFNQRRMTYLNAPCLNPSVVYTGWGYSIGDSNFANSYTVHTVIEGPSGTFTNLTASGINTMTVNIGDLFDATDIAATTIPAGQVWIRSFMTIPGGGLAYQTDYAPNSAVGDLAQQGIGLTDVAGGGTITTNMSFMLPGALICEVPAAQRAVAMITDSNGQGVGGYIQIPDGNGSGGGIGYLAGYLDTVMSNRTTPKSIGGYLHNGRTGYAAASFASSPGIDRLRFAALANITDFWNQLGANDTNTGGLGTTAASNLGIVNTQYLAATTNKITNVWQSTMVPQVTVTGPPPTDSNQADNSAGQINALNVIIRAGTIKNQTAFVEVGTEVENTTIPNVNFWRTDNGEYTSDGHHLLCQLALCNSTNAPGATAVITALIAANALNP